jgi:hypothetical protein
MAEHDSSGRNPPDNPHQIAKPEIAIDRISIASRPNGEVSVTITVTATLTDLQALDMIMRAVGTLARARGCGEAGL